MMRKLLFGAFLSLAFLFSPLHEARGAAPMLPAGADSGSIPLLPYLEYFLDESATMDIEEIAAPELSASFAPYSAERLPAATGTLWLRFTISPLGRGEKAAVQVLDMGPDIPGVAALYEPGKNELANALEWREVIPGGRDMLLLPEAGDAPITCYLRLEGLPGLWFGPTVRSPQDAAANWSGLSRSAAILALGVVLCVCLVRWLSERGQWRVWTALFVGFALLQALAGLPPQVGNPGLWGLCAILSPGIALMLLPHVARHLLRARECSRAIDIQLFLLSLPGMALALMPLLPGWSWVERWIELWPLAALIFTPTALGAWLMGLSGSRRFLLATLIPPLFTAAGVCGLYFGAPPALLASAPVWGIALAAILLAATRAPDYAAEKDQEENPAAPQAEIINLAAPIEDAQGGLSLEAGWPGRSGEKDLAARLSDLNDPNLRLVSPGEDESPAAPEKPGPDAAELALREPLDDLMREVSALEKCPLSPAARRCVDNMLGAAREMAGIMSGGPIQGAPVLKSAETVFNLQRILRDAHDAVAPAAENAGIALGWYMPPHLPQLYRGICGPLSEILRLLLESAVRASDRGAVRLAARRAPDSDDPGRILFTISDSGVGFPPQRRSSVALARAWELVGAHNGSISMESGEQGASIAFSLSFTPLDETAEETAGARVAILCENAAARREISQKLAALDARLIESASPEELLARQEASPVAVLIVAGRMASPAARETLAAFIALARKAGYGSCKIMAVHSDNSEDRELAASGFTHAIPEPLDEGELQATVRDLLAAVMRDYAPPPKPQGGQAREMRPDEAMREEDAQAPAYKVSAPEAAEPEHEAAEPEAPARQTAAATPATERTQAPQAETPESATTQSEKPELERGTPEKAEPEKLEPEAAAIGSDGAEAAESAASVSLAPEACGDAAQKAENQAAEAQKTASEESAPEAVAADVAAAEAIAVEVVPPESSAAADEVEAQERQDEESPVIPAQNEAPQAQGAPGAAGKAVEAPDAAQADAASESDSRGVAGRIGGADALRDAAVEWVGEPVPIIKKPGADSLNESLPGEAKAQDAAQKTQGAEAGSAARAENAAQPQKRALPEDDFVEWVGEPMPIGTDPAVAKKPAPRPVAPAPQERREPAESGEAKPHGASIGDFVARTINQVSATIERLARGGQNVVKAAPPDQAAQTGQAGRYAGENQSAQAPRTGAARQAPRAEAPAPRPASPAEPPREIDPAVFELVDTLDRSIGEARKAFAMNNAFAVAEYAARISEDANRFGLRHLSKMAQCVVRAGRAGDMGALRDILPELDAAVERNRLTLTQAK